MRPADLLLDGKDADVYVRRHKCAKPMSVSRLSQSGFGLAVAGAAALACAVAIPVTEVKAACLGGDGVCSTFNPSTVSTPTSVGGFTGSANASVSDPFTRALVRFNISNFTGSPFTLSDISIEGPGINASLPSPKATLSITGNGNFSTSFFALDTNLSSVNFSSSKISFTIPSGVGNGVTISSLIRYASALPDQNFSTVSQTGFTTTADVPGPLPLVGAGVAFGFSRRLRRRITSAS